ncbi:hypothetical protein HNP77_002259 [Treponema rectale]|uniref:Uncharacterized protein n=1 Tax=Treponema rectale TaxID=744512 RepID=A0A840SGK6_9SPIR|nr:hypothetical protein [Treponema rectale]
MRIINLVENEIGDSGCDAAHGHYDHSGELSNDFLTFCLL